MAWLLRPLVAPRPGKFRSEYRKVGSEASAEKGKRGGAESAAPNAASLRLKPTISEALPCLFNRLQEASEIFQRVGCNPLQNRKIARFRGSGRKSTSLECPRSDFLEVVKGKTWGVSRLPSIFARLDRPQLQLTFHQPIPLD